MYYIILGTYNPKPLFEEAWKVDTFDELVIEAEYIESNDWKITHIILVEELDD